MALSRMLQIGKAGEHLVCADLIIKGYNAFLADQGLPYDVLVDIDGKILRVQVKTTQELKNYGKAQHIYRYNLRRAKGNRTRFDSDQIDYFAFVALDIMAIAYLPISEMVVRSGAIKQIIDFKTRRIEYKGRVYPNGTVRTPTWGKYLEDYTEFRPETN